MGTQDCKGAHKCPTIWMQLGRSYVEFGQQIFFKDRKGKTQMNFFKHNDIEETEWTLRVRGFITTHRFILSTQGYSYKPIVFFYQKHNHSFLKLLCAHGQCKRWFHLKRFEGVEGSRSARVFQQGGESARRKLKVKEFWRNGTMWC